MTTKLTFQKLAVCGVRNLKTAEYNFSESVNTLVGDNGHGKTSLLESLSIVATSRSFRTDQLRDVLQKGQPLLSVSANIDQEGGGRQQKLQFTGHRRQSYINSKKISRLAEYATLTPIVVFHPSDLELVTGTALTRRNLLARIALYTDPASAEHRRSYNRALRQRQLLLENDPTDAKSLNTFESILAQHGQQLAQSNAATAAQVCQELSAVFSELAAKSLPLQTCFIGCEQSTVEDYQRRLHESRTADRQRARATFGPHHDEVELRLAGQTARQHASQGQQRLLALAIKLAELRCIQSARGLYPVLLLDDVVSELDQSRTSNVFDWLEHTQSQIFISAPRDDVVRSKVFRNRVQHVFVVTEGTLHRQTR